MSIKHLTILFLLISFVAISQSVTVTTPNGQIRGRVIGVEGVPVNTFTAIRYGEAPSGQKRFKIAQPAGKWSGTYDATTMKSICHQCKIFGGPMAVESEDCLVLNVWSPGSLTEKKPVMVWIYGGGFVTGYVNEAPSPRYNGSVLASFGVVVVSMNYRLGNLGFVTDGSDNAPGNVAFHDQLLALKWVKDNIEHFGGDPNRVTLFGESAGSIAASFHLTSPLSKGLFQKAILQSGSAYHYRGKLLDPSLVKGISKKMAAKMGCMTLNWLNCLKMISPRMIMSATDIAVPIAGDKFNPLGPVKAMKTRQWNSDVQVMSGVTEDEGSFFVTPFTQMESVTQANAKTMIKKVMGHSGFNLLQYFIEGPTVDQIYDYYFGGVSDWNNQNLLKRLMGDIWGDAIINCPNYFQMEDIVEQNKTRPYMYVMDYRSKTVGKSMQGCTNAWQGTCHAMDLPFVFGNPIRSPSTYDQDDYQVSLLFNWYWTNFAKTGNPTSGKPPAQLKIKGVEKWPNATWPQFSPTKSLDSNQQVMIINPNKIKTVKDPFAKKCNEFWRKYFK